MFGPLTLKYETQGAPLEESRAVLVALHGAGGGVSGLWELIRDATPEGVLAILPQARFTRPAQPETPVWFDVEISPDGRRVNFGQEAESRADLLAFAEALRAEPRLRGKPFALLGFHQGGIMALNLLLQRPKLSDGVVIATARMMSEVSAQFPPAPAHAGTRALWTHGDADAALPLALGEEGRRRLRDEYRVELATYDYPGGVTVPAETAARIKAWLSPLLGVAAR